MYTCAEDPAYFPFKYYILVLGGSGESSFHSFVLELEWVSIVHSRMLYGYTEEASDSTTALTLI